MNNSKYLWGFGFIILGVLFLFDQFFEEINAGEIFSIFWPVIFIFIGISTIMAGFRNWLSSLIFISLGVIMIAGNIFEYNIGQLWPLILVAIGLSILFDRGDHHTNVSSSSSKDTVETSVAFWGSEIRNDSKEFKGGTISATFGGVDLDLSDAEIAEEGATLTVNAIFGGIEIVAPKNAEVAVQGTGTLGAFENHTKTPVNKKGGVLTIKGSAVFGGVEIR